MSKPTVTRLFVIGALAVGAGAVMGGLAVGIAIATDAFVMNGPDIVGLRGSLLTWSLLGLGLVGGLSMLGGLAVGFVSWIGALLNTSRLESRAWFVALLLLGLFNLGFFAMLAYVLAGPDGWDDAPRRGAPSPASPALT
ncbi:MAG: hypothetical protein H0T59_05355 [Chloroflexi bacterium]|nr:hypothetical protein [Chloroflexota bacterium]